MSEAKSRSEYLRFRWSHRHPLHLALVRVYNALMKLVPFRLKYAIGKRLRKSKVPYSLPREGWVVVQVGAPRDTLLAGRSRGMYLSLLAGQARRIVVIEPDPESARAFREAVGRFGLDRVAVCEAAAWSEPSELRLRFKSAHPAAGFVEECATYSEDQLDQFETVAVKADRLGNLLKSIGEDRVDLLSITTNGAEEEILRGIDDQLAAGISYICLARTRESYTDLMDRLGYEFFSHDDRGFTFRRR